MKIEIMSSNRSPIDASTIMEIWREAFWTLWGELTSACNSQAEPYLQPLTNFNPTTYIALKLLLEWGSACEEKTWGKISNLANALL